MTSPVPPLEHAYFPNLLSNNATTDWKNSFFSGAFSPTPLTMRVSIFSSTASQASSSAQPPHVRQSSPRRRLKQAAVQTSSLRFRVRTLSNRISSLISYRSYRLVQPSSRCPRALLVPATTADLRLSHTGTTPMAHIPSYLHVWFLYTIVSG